jgi:tubulin beta
MQAGQCGNQMGTRFWEVVCDEHGVGGGDSEYCGDNDAQLGRISNVLCHEASGSASGGKYAPRAVLFDLEPGVVDAVRALPLGEIFRQGNVVIENAGAGSSWAKARNTRMGTNSTESSCSVPALVRTPRESSEPTHKRTEGRAPVWRS